MPADGITLLSTTAMKTTVDDLTAEFERTTGRKLRASYAPSTQIAKRIGDGEYADLAITTAERIDILVKQGRIVPGTQIGIARSSIAVGVRPGAPQPDISSTESFKHALLAAKSIGMSNPDGGGASGTHLWSVFERLGIADELKPKTTFGPGGPAGLIGFYLLRGEVEIGLQQLPELMAVAGVDVVGPVPGEFQNLMIFTAATPTIARHPEAGMALARVLTSSRAIAVLKAKGMQPA